MNFERSQRYYDAIYSWLDYDGSADYVLRLADARVSDPSDLLDVACGTGRHIERFGRRLNCVGSDLDPAFLAVARQRCPDVDFVESDMCELDVGRRFDIVTCLFSAIGYVMTVVRLERAIARMATHLRPEGILVLEPWISPEDWRTGETHARFFDEDVLKGARITVAGHESDVATLDFHYLVADGTEVESFTEHHELRLFSDDEYRRAFAAAGLQVEHDPEGPLGRGLYLGSPSGDDAA